MASDNLNEISKYIRHTRDDVDWAEKRQFPHYKDLERSRDMFDHNNSFTMSFRKKKNKPLHLSLDFDVPPSLRQCVAGCIHTACRSFSFADGANHVVNVGESYKQGTVRVFISDNPVAFAEDNPVSGDVSYTGSGSGPDQVTVCYLHDECNPGGGFQCIDGQLQNCVQQSTTIAQFTANANFTGPFNSFTNPWPFSTITNAWETYDPNPVNINLAFPGSRQTFQTFFDVNRLTAPFSIEQNHAVTVTLSTTINPPYGIGIYSPTLNHSIYTTTTGTGSYQLVADQRASDWFVYTNAGNFYEPGLTGEGIASYARTLGIGTSGDSAGETVGTAFMQSTGASDFGFQLPYLAGAPWNRNAGTIRWRFGVSQLGSDYSVHFGMGNIDLEVNPSAQSLSLTTGSGTATGSTVPFAVGPTYIAEMMYDLVAGYAQARVYDASQSPPAYQVFEPTAGELAFQGSYFPSLYIRLNNRSTTPIKITLSTIDMDAALVGAVPPTIDPLNATDVVSVGLGGPAAFKTWPTIIPDAQPYLFAPVSESLGYGAGIAARWQAGIVGDPTSFGVHCEPPDCLALEAVTQSTAGVTVAGMTEQQWQTGYFFRVSGEYNLSTVGCPKEGVLHGETEITVAFTTYNFGDKRNAFAFPYQILGGVEQYKSHNLSWNTSSGWLPFSFSAANHSSGSGVSFATGQPFDDFGATLPPGTVIFQWGVAVLQDPMKMASDMGTVRNCTIFAAAGRGGITVDTRNIQVELVKPNNIVLGNDEVPNCGVNCNGLNLPVPIGDGTVGGGGTVGALPGSNPTPTPDPAPTPTPGAGGGSTTGGDTSGGGTGTTASPTVPGTPFVTATQGTGQIALSWPMPAPGGAAITGFTIYRGISGATPTLYRTQTTTTFTDTGLSNGTSYSYQVSATNSVGEGPKSPVLTIILGQVVPPSSFPNIDHTGATDVTAALNAALRGATGTVTLASNGIYKISGQINLETKNNFTLDMNNATIRQVTRRTDPILIVHYGSSNVVIKNGTIQGVNPFPGYWNETYEHNHGIELDGIIGGEVFNVTIKNVGGDGFYLSSAFLPGGGQRVSDGIHIHNCTVDGTGRMGVAITDGANNVVIDFNRFMNIAYYDIDFEANGHIINGSPAGGVHVRFSDNILGPHPYSTGGNSPETGIGLPTGHVFVVTGTSGGGPADDVEVSRNQVTGRSFDVGVYNNGGLRRNIRVNSNTSDTRDSGPTMEFQGVNTLQVIGNRQPLSSGSLILQSGCTNVTISNNSTA
jgi:hypothetical protein